MNDLRLIILGLGLVLIAAIYLWEIFKQRERQRRQTVRHKSGDSEFNGLQQMPSRGDTEDISRVISDLNDFLVRAKLHEDETVDTINQQQARELYLYTRPTLGFTISAANERQPA